MCSGRRTISLGFTGEPMQEGLHICYIYNDDAERQRVIARFMESGLLDNEKVLCLADEVGREEMMDSLDALGMDVRSGALSVLDAMRTYCPSGRFEQEEMLGNIRDFYRQALEEGYSGARGTGDMGWSLGGRATEAELIEYEARVNHVVAEHPCTACCQYDARRFSGQVMMDVLSIHPMTIVRGQLVRNPYYIEPEAFLREFRARP